MWNKYRRKLDDELLAARALVGEVGGQWGFGVCRISAQQPRVAVCTAPAFPDLLRLPKLPRCPHPPPRRHGR
jgi:hypothetical protein